MFPPKNDYVFERISETDFVNATIEDIKYDMAHEFAWVDPKDKTKKMVAPAIKFRFSLDGYKFPKETQWMKFSMDERSNLFTKYVSSLVEGAKEYMEFDLDILKGMRIKMLWKANPKNPDYQVIDSIRPMDAKVTTWPKLGNGHVPPVAIPPVPPTDEEVPF